MNEKMSVKKFVLNDEEVANSYGFYILTSGGRLDRFRDNPVMLNGHINTNENVIGKWNNLSVEGGKIIAEPEFDTAMPKATEIKGQVDRDYLKGASMGIIPDWTKVERIGERLVLKEWELVEASIVPVPSNRNAIAIYSAEGVLLEEEEVKKLCLSINKNQNKKSFMKKVLLSVATLLALGYDSKAIPAEGVDEKEIEDKIIGLSNQKKALEAENQALKLSIQQAKEKSEQDLLQKVTQQVELAIKDGQITADKKDDFIKLGVTDPHLLETTLLAIPKKTTFAGGIKTPEATAEVTTKEDFFKLSTEEQLAFKNENFEVYKKIFIN